MFKSSFGEIGSLYMRVGPMRSGKTTWLNGELTKYADQNVPVSKIIHSNDIRDDVSYSGLDGTTHNSSHFGLSEKIKIFRTHNLSDLNNEIKNFNIIGVDESHLYPDLYDTIKLWVEEYHKNIFIVGLDGSYKRKEIGDILKLIPLSDDIKKMKGGCHFCIENLMENNYHGSITNAPFTMKYSNLENDSDIDIGGNNKYYTVCRKHFRNPGKK